MAYRWLSVDIDVTDAGVEVTVQGRGPVLPFAETVTLTPDESARVYALFETEGPFTNEEYQSPSGPGGGD